VHQKLHIPFRAPDGTLDHAFHVESDLARKLDDSVDRRLALRLLTHDAALPDFVFPHFELRLDQRHELAAEKLHDRGKNQLQGDERDVDRNEIDGLVEILRLQIARIHLLAIHHAGIVAQ